MTGFDKSQLPHTQWKGRFFTTTRFLHQWTTKSIYVFIANGSLVCFCWGLFLGPVWCAWVLGWSTNGNGVTRQAFTQLEITTQLARKLGHQIGNYLWYLELKQASMRPSGSVQLVQMEDPPLYGSSPSPTFTPI